MINNSERRLKKTVFFIRLFLFLTFLVIIIVLIYVNTYPSGRAFFAYQAGGGKSYGLSLLEPEYRVSEVVEISGQKARILISNPVYFNLRTVLPFKKAKVKIVYRNPKNYQFKIGGLVNKDLWQFDLKEISPTSNNDEWLIGRAEFDMTNYYRENNNYRFILSVPYLELDNQPDGLAVQGISVELERESLTFKTFCKKLFNKIKRKFKET